MTHDGPVPGQGEAGLVQGRLIGPEIDLKKQRPFIDILPFPESDLGQLAAQHGLYRDTLRCLHNAEDLDLDRHILLPGNSGHQA